MDFSFGVTVVLHRQIVTGDRDEYGDTIRQSQDLTFTNCATWAGASNEEHDNQTTVMVDRTVVLPHGTVVKPTDTVTVGDDPAAYGVYGQPDDPVNPFTGWAPGVIVELRRIDG